jgi:hypothetical protein
VEGGGFLAFVVGVGLGRRVGNMADGAKRYGVNFGRPGDRRAGAGEDE